jgi:hypothetical protein
VDGVVGGAERSIARVDGVVTGAEASVARVDGVVSGAQGSVQRVEGVLADAGGLVGRATGLLGEAEEPLTRLMPALRRMSETLEPREVDAAILLIDRLPELLASVDDDVLPLVRSLSKVEPELHELLEIVQDVHRLISGLPGARLWRSRGKDDPDVG